MAMSLKNLFTTSYGKKQLRFLERYMENNNRSHFVENHQLNLLKDIALGKIAARN